MKIKRIIAENVYGYMNFDEKLENDITFLIGCNGSGKTTLLNLIRALLEPSLELLMKIDFSYVELQLVDENKLIRVLSKKNNEEKVISLTIEKESPITRDLMLSNLSAMTAEDRQTFFEELDVVQEIKKLDCFGYISVNRNFQYKKRKFGIIPSRFSSSKKDLSEIDVAMLHIQRLIFDRNMDISIYKSSVEEKFRSEMFKTSLLFKKNNFSSDLFGNYSLFGSWKKQLSEEKEQFYSFVTAFTKDETNYNDLFKELEHILDKLINLTENPSFDKANPPIEYYTLMLQWMINQDNIERIDKMIALGKDFNDKIEKSRKKFKIFVEILNRFFNQSGKKIKIDDRGQIIATISSCNKNVDVMNMSSGEKHLMIIFAFLMFYIRNKSIVVVDEPEISLHIGWQEIFVDSLKDANPGVQYILATHAPSIISKKERQEWCIDLSRK